MGWSDGACSRSGSSPVMRSKAEVVAFVDERVSTLSLDGCRLSALVLLVEVAGSCLNAVPVTLVDRGWGPPFTLGTAMWGELKVPPVRLPMREGLVSMRGRLMGGDVMGDIRFSVGDNGPFERVSIDGKRVSKL